MEGFAPPSPSGLPVAASGGLLLRLLLVTEPADGLEVGIVIRAACGFWHDVVNGIGGGDDPLADAGLTQSAISLHDAIAALAPAGTIATLG